MVDQKTISVRMGRELYERLDRYSKEESLQRSTVIRKAIESYLNQPRINPEVLKGIDENLFKQYSELDKKYSHMLNKFNVMVKQFEKFKESK